MRCADLFWAAPHSCDDDCDSYGCWDTGHDPRPFLWHLTTEDLCYYISDLYVAVADWLVDDAPATLPHREEPPWPDPGRRFMPPLSTHYVDPDRAQLLIAAGLTIRTGEPNPHGTLVDYLYHGDQHVGYIRARQDSDPGLNTTWWVPANTLHPR